MNNSQPIEWLCRILTGETSSSGLKSLSASDWSALYHTAQQHDLTLILYDKLQSLHRQVLIPKHLLSQMRQEYLVSTGRNLVILNKVSLILQALVENNIPVIGLKGIYLVENLYHSIGLRTFCDLDLMVKKSHLQPALNCLEGLGYQLTTYFNLEDVNRDIKHIPPMIDADGLVIEVHWTILEEDEPFTIDADGLWARATPAKIAGVQKMTRSHCAPVCPPHLPASSPQRPTLVI